MLHQNSMHNACNAVILQCIDEIILAVGPSSAARIASPVPGLPGSAQSRLSPPEPASVGCPALKQLALQLIAVQRMRS